jgi:hypothetical protein
MCQNCGNAGCGGCKDCEHPVEIKYTSQIQYDGPRIEYPEIDLVIEKCTPLNEIIALFAEKLNELNP